MRKIRPKDANAPKYEAIAKELRKAIGNGAYSGKIPSVRELASSYHVNVKTAVKAVRSLRAEGLLTRQWGMHVRPKNTAENIGLLVRTSGHLFENFAKALVGTLQETGRFPIINDISTNAFNVNAAMYLEQMLSMNPSALVVESGFQEPLPRWDMLAKKYGAKTDFIFTYGYDFPDEVPASYVLTDYTHGAYLAAKHLAALGHTRIMLLTFAHPVLPKERAEICLSSQLVRGCQKALDEHGGTLIRCEQPPGGVKDHHAAITEHREKFRSLLAKERPTAIIGSSDYQIVSHYPIIRELGMTAPRDIALIGYNNTPWTEMFEVPLTSVSLREDELARIAADMCIHADKRQRKVIVTPELIVRSSTGASPASTADISLSKEHP